MTEIQISKQFVISGFSVIRHQRLNYYENTRIDSYLTKIADPQE